VLIGEILDELVVDLREDRVEPGTESQRNAQHARELCRTERRTDTVPRRIAEHDEQATVVEMHQVERIATGLVGRHEAAGHVVTG
jgi:hypothetical protein